MGCDNIILYIPIISYIIGVGGRGYNIQGPQPQVVFFFILCIDNYRIILYNGTINKYESEEYMSKTRPMQKWQRDHFVRELDRKYAPLLETASLKLKAIEAEAIEIAEKNLADEIGATPIIQELQQAIENYISKMSKAARFFCKAGNRKGQDVSYKFEEKKFSIGGYSSTYITVEDCWEQVRDWASSLAREKISKTPEGAILKQLEDNKRASYREIMEAGSPDSLKGILENNLQKDGLGWKQETKALPPSNVN